MIPFFFILSHAISSKTAITKTDNYLYNSRHSIWRYFIFYIYIYSYLFYGLKIFFRQREKMHINRHLVYLGSSRHFFSSFIESKLNLYDIKLVTNISRFKLYIGLGKNINTWDFKVYFRTFFTLFILYPISFFYFLWHFNRTTFQSFSINFFNLVFSYYALISVKPKSILLRDYERIEFNSLAIISKYLNIVTILYPHAYSTYNTIHNYYTYYFFLGEYQRISCKYAKSKNFENIRLVGDTNVVIEYRDKKLLDLDCIKVGFLGTSSFTIDDLKSLLNKLTKLNFKFQFYFRDHPGHDQSNEVRKLGVFYSCNVKNTLTQYLDTINICISSETNAFLQSSYMGCLNITFSTSDSYKFISQGVVYGISSDINNHINYCLNNYASLSDDQRKRALLYLSYPNSFWENYSSIISLLK